jgi:multiple sugar transport system ATP-binding protein
LRLRQSLAGRVGQRIVLGIRPEHLHLHPVEDHCPIELKLNVIEPLGNDMDLYMESNLTDRVVARVEASGQAAGLRGDARVTLYVDLRKIHFFEPGDTGMNLSLSPGFSSEPTHALA